MGRGFQPSRQTDLNAQHLWKILAPFVQYIEEWNTLRQRNDERKIKYKLNIKIILSIFYDLLFVF
jgi:hypothetical protein